MEAKSPFQLVATKVIEFKYKSYIDGGETRPPDIDINYELYFPEEDEYHSELKLNIKGKILTKKNKKLMDFSFIFQGVFESKEDIGIDLFKKMSEQNGLVSMLHMSRSIIFGATSLCGLNPGFTLPMINVLKLKELHDKKLSGENS